MPPVLLWNLLILLRCLTIACLIGEVAASSAFTHSLQNYVFSGVTNLLRIFSFLSYKLTKITCIFLILFVYHC